MLLNIKSVKERKDVTDEEMLYEFYSLDSLKYLIDMLSQLKISLDSTTEDTQESKEEKDKKDKKNDEPLYDCFPLVDLDDLLEQKSIDIEIPQLDKFIESNAKVPAINVDEYQYKFVLESLFN